ncbi:MAG: Ig-like domain-containing protein, partial [Acidimicrobiia bacterium]|nr:Ig-like domain-containing protein [Acidimicrobiia bacterium]
ATVTITVNPVPDPPVANDDIASTSEDAPIGIDVLANDTDPDDDGLTITNLTQPANGTASIQPDATITYTPDPDFNGIDTFTYTANDGTTDSAPATVTVNVTPVNDPPVANDDSDSTNEDTAVNTGVLANDSDPEGSLDPATTGVTGAPSNGSAVAQPDGSITYTPDPDFNGADAYIYEVCDSGGLCDTATVSITINPVPDPPVANDDSASTGPDTAVNVDVLGNDTDPDGDLDTSTLQVTVPAVSGSTVVESDDTITYTPDPGTSGSDTFTYQICDATALCDTAVVAITVSSTVVEQFALGETTIEGTVSGSFNDTFAPDAVYEEVIEAHSGGPRRNRQSFAEHRWTFDIQRGDSIEVFAVAYHSANNESDDFEFQYSTDGGSSFQPLFIVTATGAPVSYSAPLPAVISGEVILQAKDTDRTPGNGATDSLFVDYLVIRTTNPQTPLPVVTVAAPDDSASESGDDAAFVISRDDTNGPLTVGFSLGGTATETSDYAPLGTSVDFPDGQAQVTLVVDAVDDGVAEGDESVELTLSPGSTYQRGSPSFALVTIADNNVAGTEARAITET